MAKAITGAERTKAEAYTASLARRAVSAGSDKSHSRNGSRKCSKAANSKAPVAAANTINNIACRRAAGSAFWIHWPEHLIYTGEIPP
jgi:hypothetical protein